MDYADNICAVQIPERVLSHIFGDNLVSVSEVIT